MKLYAIQDTLAGFKQPFVLQNDDLAIRTYKITMEKIPESEDCRLYYLGEYNNDTGKIEPVTPTCIYGGIKNDGVNVSNSL